MATSTSSGRSFQGVLNTPHPQGPPPTAQQFRAGHGGETHERCHSNKENVAHVSRPPPLGTHLPLGTSPPPKQTSTSPTPTSGRRRIIPSVGGLPPLIDLELLHTETLTLPEAESGHAVALGKRSKLVRRLVSMKSSWMCKEINHLTCTILVPSLGVLVSGCEDGNVVIWRRKSATGHKRDVKWLRGHKGHVACVVHRPPDVLQGTPVLLFSGSADATIKVWDATARDFESACVQTLIGHGGTVTCLAIVGDHIISGSTDKSIRIWRTIDGRDITLYPWFEPQRVVAVLEGWVTSMSFGCTHKVGDLGMLYAADSKGGVTAFCPRPLERSGSRRSSKLDFECCHTTARATPSPCTTEWGVTEGLLPNIEGSNTETDSEGGTESRPGTSATSRSVRHAGGATSASEAGLVQLSNVQERQGGVVGGGGCASSRQSRE